VPTPLLVLLLTLRRYARGLRAQAAAAAVCATAAVCACIWAGRAGGRQTALRSRQYWSKYYADAPPYPRYGSAQYTGYPSYAAMPLGRRPSYYSSDVNVEEAIGLPNNIDDLNFKTKEGKKAVASLRDVIASIAFEKKIDKLKDEDRAKVDITDITSIPAVITKSEIYPEKRAEGTRVDFIVKAANAHAADDIIGLLTESKLTKGLIDAKILGEKRGEGEEGPAGRATILAVTTSAFATPMYDDNQTWGQENATQAAAYEAYLRVRPAGPGSKGSAPDATHPADYVTLDSACVLNRSSGRGMHGLCRQCSRSC